ncbi:MAG: ribonuclease HII [Proteobacteria bacterium]|nr:ribonuclease HII [Pseudomonadota bacterium]
MPDLSFEVQAWGDGYHHVAGIDEAGRGPLAGPVIAAAVVFRERQLPDDVSSVLDDSKRLSEKKREWLFDRITEIAHVGVGRAEVDEIDDINILQATMAAMARSVGALPVDTDYALVDGNRIPKLDCPAEAVVKGDGRSFSIAAASIIAKVTRDRLMSELAILFPGYDWEKNAGYGTEAHRKALETLGVTKHHRKTFAPINNMLSPRVI